MNVIEKSEKTEQLIYKEVGDIVLSWANENGYSGWVPRQWAQPTMQALKSKSIFMNFMLGRRYGWTSTVSKWDRESSKGTTKVSWLRDLNMVFTFFKDSSPIASNSGSSYISATDVAWNLLTWMQSDFGIQKFMKSGYNMLQTFSINNPKIVVGTDQFDRTPNFEIIFVIKEHTLFDTTENFVLYGTQKEAFDSDSMDNLVIGMTPTQILNNNN